jgi:hypothetical protein
MIHHQTPFYNTPSDTFFIVLYSTPPSTLLSYTLISWHSSIVHLQTLFCHSRLSSIIPDTPLSYACRHSSIIHPQTLFYHTPQLRRLFYHTPPDTPLSYTSRHSSTIHLQTLFYHTPLRTLFYHTPLDTSLSYTSRHSSIIHFQTLFYHTPLDTLYHILRTFFIPSDTWRPPWPALPQDML